MHRVAIVGSTDFNGEFVAVSYSGIIGVIKEPGQFITWVHGSPVEIYVTILSKECSECDGGSLYIYYPEEDSSYVDEALQKFIYNGIIIRNTVKDLSHAGRSLWSKCMAHAYDYIMRSIPTHYLLS